MTANDTRFLRDIQQLKREAKRAIEREKQTRQGCFELAGALQRLIEDAGGGDVSVSPTATEQLAQAAALLAAE